MIRLLSVTDVVVQHLKRMPSPNECMRALRNASRVKVIRFGEWQWSRSMVSDMVFAASSEGLHTLRTYCDTHSISPGIPRILFPNLHTLHWDWFSGDAPSFNQLPFIVPVSLRTLEITGIPPTSPSDLAAAVDSAFSQLLKRGKSLKAVRMDLHDPHRLGLDDRKYFERILDLPELESYHPQVALSKLSLLQLGVHPHLQDTSIKMDLNEDDQSLSPLAVHPLFHSLRHLDVSHPKLAVCTRVLEFVRSPCLESISVCGTGNDAEITQPRLTRLLRALQCHQYMQQVSVRCYPSSNFRQKMEGGYTKTPRSIAMVTLRPLTALRNITRIHFYLNDTVLQLMDRDLETFSRAWPGLEELTMSSDSPYQPKPGVTLEGIFILVTNCPKLSVVGLSVDVTWPNDPLRRLVQERAGTGQRRSQDDHTLNVTIHYTKALEVTDMDGLARFFYEHLPSLDRVVCYGHLARDVEGAHLIHDSWLWLSFGIQQLQGSGRLSLVRTRPTST